ncbi:MAG: AbrB/MazE/SpoVT family DNA-binding domain-containing protein [Armatimonadetes bacterium]|nr:AbrB/MazE/SpoVT family DNA-binding domain-containing protein [Armatimonadota bacterium]
METRISPKGQITLPVAVRKKLGINAGDVLKVSVAGEGRIILESKATTRKNAREVVDILRATAGAWKDLPESGEEFVRKLREGDQKRWEELGVE